jgi:hypothetical protein
MYDKIMIYVFILMLFIGCKTDDSIDMGLSMTHNELVNALIDLATINGATNLNEISAKDSLAQLYFSKIEMTTGHNIVEIRRNLDILIKYPDTLLMLQNRALDTLRAMQERELKINEPAK